MFVLEGGMEGRDVGVIKSESSNLWRIFDHRVVVVVVAAKECGRTPV